METVKQTISVSQALQIAGRAGRYGSVYSKGYVTTLKSKDLNTLKQLLSEEPEPIKCAGLLPTIDQMELFSYYLPQSTFVEIIDILVHLTTVDNSTYFICDLNDFKLLAQLIEHVSLPLRVKFVFCCAPINKKLQFPCAMFVKFAKMYSLNQAVTVSWVCKKIGWPVGKPQNIRELTMLEAYHEVLELYLWLSNRFEEYFPDVEMVRKIQRSIDTLIQEGVTNLINLGTEGEKPENKKEVDFGGVDNDEEKPTQSLM